MHFIILFLSLLLCLSFISTEGNISDAMATMDSSTVCSREHMMEAVRQSSYCHPILKVVKLEMPGNGSYTQVVIFSLSSVHSQ